VTRLAEGRIAMFIMLSTIVSATGVAALVGMVPAPGLVAASRLSSSAAATTLLRSRAQSRRGGLAVRQRGRQASNDDCP